MKWSFSASTTFRMCPRKWFYANSFASSLAKHPDRKEAYYLKQLQSISAWRGSLVDTVIGVTIVPELKKGRVPNEKKVMDYASYLAKKQVEFGKDKRHREPKMTKSEGGTSYCAFYDMEYSDRVDQSQLKLAQAEATTALKNLLRSKLLEELAQNNSHLVAQRSIRFEFAGASVVCTPDLIVFYENAPPLIIDWKVHSFAYSDYRLQLALYALALTRVEPHRDFPELKVSPTEVGLIEYQLLKNTQRQYELTSDDITDLEDHIYHSFRQIRHTTEGRKAKDLEAEMFQTARSPKICAKCQFKKICWKKTERKPVQLEVFA